MTAPIYEKRAKMVSKIENFWPLVLEASPPDIDQFIQPSDSEVLSSALTNIDIQNFEIVDGKVVPGGDVRSISITFEFKENEWFTDSKLEKKFWYRRHADGWAGLVSEPLKINWKKGKDLTEGLLDLTCNLWEAEQSGKGLKAAQETLEKALDNASAVSFFSFFGFIGRRVSKEESAKAMALEAEVRAGTKEDEDYEPSQAECEAEEKCAMLEIFPDGDDLAIALGEDLWPSAIKYFSEQPHEHGDGCNDGCCGSDEDEDEELSEADFEDLDEDDFEGFDEDEDDEAPQLKKVKK